MLYSGIPHPTAALFLSGSFIDRHEKVCIITDSIVSRKYIEEVGAWIFSRTLRSLKNPGELFRIDSFDEKIILIDTHMFQVGGNLESIRRAHTLEIQRDTTHHQNTLIENLLAFGFHQSNFAGESGTYKREGSIITIWQEDREYQIEYFDDVIESIVEKNPSGRFHRESIILCREIVYNPTETLGISLDLIRLLKDMPTLLIGCEFLKERDSIIAEFRNIREYSSLSRESSERLTINPIKIETLSDFLEVLQEKKADIPTPDISVSRYESKLREFLDVNHFGEKKSLEYKHLQESFSLSGNLDLLGEKWRQYAKNNTFTLFADDIFSKIFIQNRVRKTTIKNLDLLLRIEKGDLIVHREHGIGRYIQILQKRIGLIEREYMEVEYRGGDKVYVPMTELSRITKYVGDSATELSGLEGKEWERTLSKTDEEVEIIAQDILETDAKRSLTTRIPFSRFPQEEEFQKAFAYTHTPDQASIIESIREDMEGPHPMDRLIAGDVGFGKTEVAMNAVYKAVLSGVQVAVISPLLILAEEHRETFEERLGAFGVAVRSLTRMTHRNEAKKILESLREGKIDVIIGTHRLLSEDIRFRRLGLLIIDEEHRFGVAQKEAIKKMKSHVDILSLSATPIPRSLNLALSGLKKISLLTTPPPRKKPIDTIVARWDEMTVKSAIEKELSRGGQIIILHNRIRSLPMIESEIYEILSQIPKAETKDSQKQEVRGRKEIRSFSESWKIITTHGQMNPDDIEDSILAFKEHKYDILLTTTIIENGVNFLGANTIIVSDAEEFGLAQLHQIRGRVGRKDVAGVCYLLYRKYELSHEERERLMILAEHSALGSGYEIAMRDMQMRGTGDILGFRQSGKTKEVGMSLYFQLLEEKIEALKNGKKEENQCKIELELSYRIDDEEFDSEMDKLSFFRDIESIESLEDLDIAESTFRRDIMPESMSNLFIMMRASIILKSYSVIRVSKIGNAYHFDFSEDARPETLRRFLDRFDSGKEMIIVSIRKIKVDMKNWKTPRDFLLALVR